MAFLPGPSARKHLTQPTQDQVDLRAACFCHRKIIDIGYVCSVCLSSESLAVLCSLDARSELPRSLLLAPSRLLDLSVSRSGYSIRPRADQPSFTAPSFPCRHSSDWVSVRNRREPTEQLDPRSGRSSEVHLQVA